ncbi:hypothetical protein ABT095_13775 [Kitasatospora sp. NPDC002227]|uniref:hypothetical protein n=1 Tax=Kitasatospora sp. NPDC002227 TaxID=3154773 RepID=UPI003330DCBD
MPYSIDFLDVPPGRTFDEVLEERNAAYDWDAEPEPIDLTDGQVKAWERLSERVAREVGPIESEVYPYSLTLHCYPGVGRIQVDYAGDSASVEITYRYSGEAARAIMREVYRIGRMIEEECGLEGADGEVGQTVRDGDPEVAAARLAGVSGWARENLT